MRKTLKSLSVVHKLFILLAVDAVLIPMSLWVSISLRYGSLYYSIDKSFLIFSALTGFSLVVFYFFGFYRVMMRHLGLGSLKKILLGSVASVLILLVLLMLQPGSGVPRSTFIIYGFILFVFIAASRIFARRILNPSGKFLGSQRVAIYGAGSAGCHLLSALARHREYQVVCFIDDNINLKKRIIDDVPVLFGGDENLLDQLKIKDISLILLAMPSISNESRREIIQRLENFPFRVLTVPPINDLILGKAQVGDLQDVSIEDLLGRASVAPIDSLLNQCIQGKTVLVTGAGGSIGSEICRQAIIYGARQLILFENSEFSLYQIEHELKRFDSVSRGDVKVIPLLGSVTDERRLTDVFNAFAIDTVYHAAAYKHVPLVEHNQVEGVVNNAFGTFTTALAAAKAEIDNFVLISTDKAVRPTNVMGASKRLAEISLQVLQTQYPDTVFSMVRFGNVLGSSGSVVPLFRQQLQSGQGFLTVTHPEINRYFMTIPEAVQLVIQAGAMANGGEVFVLDMGEPVRIADLARRMIHLSGFTVRDHSNPDGDVEIRFSGLRPGEKLYEELLIGDAVRGTRHPKIMCADEDFIAWDEFLTVMGDLRLILDARDLHGLRSILVRLVSGYSPGERIEDLLWHGDN